MRNLLGLWGPKTNIYTFEYAAYEDGELSLINLPFFCIHHDLQWSQLQGNETWHLGFCDKDVFLLCTVWYRFMVLTFVSKFYSLLYLLSYKYNMDFCLSNSTQCLYRYYTANKLTEKGSSSQSYSTKQCYQLEKHID